MKQSIIKQTKIKPFLSDFLPRLFLLCAIAAFLFYGCGAKPADEAATENPSNAAAEEAKLSPDGNSQKIVVTIEHAYEPSHIIAKAGVPLVIEFFRNESVSSCAREITFPKLGKNVSVPNHATHTVTIAPQQAGTLPFHCTMDMMKGVIEFK